MFNRKNINLKLFLATIFAVIGIHSLDLSAVSHNLIPGIKVSNQAIAYPIKNSPNHPLQDKELIAKRSGGRSGGGSFKSRSSSSKSRSSSSSSTKRRSSSSSSTRRNSSSSYDSSPTDKTSPQHSTSPTPTPTYTHSDSSNSQELPWYMSAIIVIISLLILAGMTLLPIGLIFWLIYSVFKTFSRLLNRDHSDDIVERKINRERDNNQVTVSQLQVALSPQAEGLQQELSTLSLSVNTNTDAGLAELMGESALVLLRHEKAWTHVLADSNSLHISNAEEVFSKISFAERSKFSSESLSNVDGNVKTKETVSYDGEDFSNYVVVTLILGTADDNPLFSKIHTEKQLKEVLLKLASMREDYLMKFELLWTPQKEGEYLTDDEFLMEYTNMIKLV